ncbi:MAG TPA: aldo/keto reductase [Candidatus Binatia bacterium]|jgi:aryl-alcohol dehydrogenase-like predicted oxidoreductase
MVPRPLGRTGLVVSPIGLGTTKLGRNTDVKYPELFALPTDGAVRDLLETGLALGLNLIDTAPAYGESEQRLGAFVESHRNRIVLCTKCGEQYKDGVSTYDFSAGAIVASTEESLRRLRTDHLDILLLHSNGRDLEILTQTDALEGLGRLKKTGKARAVGISAKTDAGISRACETLDVVMAPFSERETSLSEALKKAHDQGLGVLAIKGLYSGHLEAPRAIEFVLKQPFIDALILGTINQAHLKEAVRVAAACLNPKSKIENPK